MEEFFPMKEQSKVMSRDLSETDISNMPGEEFEGTIIRLLTGVWKRI